MNQELHGKKILLLYTAHTVGHQRIAENIAYWLERSGGHVELREVLKSSPSRAVQYFLKLHVWVNTYAPWFWRFLYVWGFWFTMMPLRLPVAWFQKKEIQKCIFEIRPDLIITTQTSPSAVMSILKWAKIYTGLWGVAFSDYHFHRGWVYPRADFYLTNIESQAERLVFLGVQNTCIFRIGFALSPVPTSDQTAVRQQLGIPASAKVLLIGSGSLGVRFPRGLLAVCDQVVTRLRARSAECRVIVACGRSREVLEELQAAREERPWLIPLSFYSPMHDLYAMADVFITKPGGLSVAEAGRLRVPLIITHILPGQEEFNLRYLADHNYVVSLVDVPQVQWAGRIAEVVFDAQSAGSGHADFVDVLLPKSLSGLGTFIVGLFHKN